jgi:hypothetical protein
MLSLPITCSRVMGVFAPVFSRPVWPPVNVLLTGAVLAPGTRTVTAILRILGRRAAPHVQPYHRVLNRAVWSPLSASRLLLRLFVAVCVPRGVVLCGLDDTSARRRGQQMSAQGISRDPVRSSQTPVVQASGLRWRSASGASPFQPETGWQSSSAARARPGDARTPRPGHGDRAMATWRTRHAHADGVRDQPHTGEAPCAGRRSGTVLPQRRGERAPGRL